MAFGQEVGRVLSDGRIVGRAEPFAKVFASSRAVKREVGLAAWAVLEDIAAAAVLGRSRDVPIGLMRPAPGMLGRSVPARGRRGTAPPQDLAVVFQDYARSLFPWLTTTANVALPLKDRDLAKEEIRHRTAESLAAVGLAEAGARHPWQLSGMRQRVAIARALALSPSVLLMDEPFASVDAQTRAELEDLLLQICDQYRMTVVFITHDIDEAVYLSDRVVVLSRPPTVVLEEVDVSLDRPRDQIETKRLDAYHEVRGEILRRIMSTSTARGATPTSP
jgi:NitT/TauT family transport system ATP-binding protein